MQLPLVHDSSLAFEMIPETSARVDEGEEITGSLAPGTHLSCCVVLSCRECFEKADRAFDGPHSALDSRFDILTERGKGRGSVGRQSGRAEQQPADDYVNIRQHVHLN